MSTEKPKPQAAKPNLATTQVMVRSPLLGGGGGDDAEHILRDIGRALRRVEGTVKTDRSGLRVVWHQSKLRTELLSWENSDRTLDRQELTFFGKMVEYRQKGGLRTGTVPNSAMQDEAVMGVTKSELFLPSRELDVMVLDAASRILRECNKRDFYTQHLLQIVNDTLSKLDNKALRTQVNGLDFFRTIEEAGRAAREDTASGGAVAGAPANTKLIVGILAACAVIAVAVFIFLWRG